MTADLTQFLLARITEDEAAGREPWSGEAKVRRQTVIESQRKIDANEPGVQVYDNALRELASRYTDHPDYRDEWRPDDDSAGKA
jgi:hypothetical protein